jgi:hypothetical protein
MALEIPQCSKCSGTSPAFESPGSRKARRTKYSSGFPCPVLSSLLILRSSALRTRRGVLENAASAPFPILAMDSHGDELLGNNVNRGRSHGIMSMTWQDLDDVKVHTQLLR